MKIALACLGALGLLVVAGSEFAVGPQSGKDDAMAVPAWLGISDTEYMTSIEHTGPAGSEAESGVVVMDLPSDGEAEVKWLAQHLTQQGFQLEDRLTNVDRFFGDVEFVVATDPVTGRRVHLTLTQKIDGTLLRVTFSEPGADLRVAEF